MSDPTNRAVLVVTVVVLGAIAAVVGSVLRSGTTVQGVVAHPTPDNVPAEGETAPIRRDVSPPLQPLAASAGWRFREVLRLGVEEESAGVIFGLVQDISVDDAGLILVLDGRLNSVGAFHSSGELLWKMGRPGLGPEDFEAPEAIAVVGNGVFAVADRRGLVKYFGYDSLGTRWRSQVLVGLSPEGMCALGSELYLQASHPSGTVVHRVLESVGVLDRFGKGYRSRNPVVANQLSDGPIGCHAATKTIVFARRYLPFLYGFGSDGVGRWTARLDGFEAMELLELPDGGFRPIPPNGSFQTVVGIVGLDETGLLVQLATHSTSGIREGRLVEHYDSFLIDAASGSGQWVSESLPRVHAARGGSVYASVTDPFPQVVVLQLSRP